MKKRILLSAMLLCGGFAFAQKDNVGIGTTNPDQSAALDVNSSNKGLLMPRMSLQQRNAIQNPAKGLIVYQTDMLSGFYYYDGKEWKGMGSNTTEKSVAGTDGDWTLIGNSGTNPATNFLGTTDAQPLVIKTGNVERMRVTAAGDVTVANNFIFDNTTGAKGFNYKRGGLNRWIQQVDGAETGSNSGSNFLLYRYDDAGGYLGTSLDINRATGLTTFGGNTRFQGNFEIDGTVTNRFFTYTKGGNNRFAFQLDGAEGGGNTGSDFYFYRYNDAGVYQGAMLKFTRGTGESKFFNSVKINTVTGHLAVGDFDGVGLTTPAGYRLIVQDGILTEKIKVAIKTSGDWADYVFEPSYKLMSLDKVESFIKENKHLPNVPSAEDMSKNGLDVTQTSAKLMEKIEELTLYMIEMNKEIKALKEENAKLKNK